MGVRKLVLDIADARFEEALPILRGIVVGVLRNVAVRAGLGERVHHRRPLNCFQPLELGLEALGAFDRHRNSGHVCRLVQSLMQRLDRVGNEPAHAG